MSDSTELNNEFHASIQKIIEAKNQNKLVLFIGAGVSVNSDIPSWNSLIKALRADLNLDDTEQDFVKIAELYYRQRGHNEYLTKVRQTLKHNRAKYTSLHKQLFDLKPLHIVTTNYDNLLEQFSFEHSLPYEVIKQDQDLPYAKGNNYIIKMHGDLDIGNIVLKEKDYLSYSENFPLIESYIKSLFASKLVLFVGFSYSDWNIKFISQKVLTQLKENIQPAYLIELETSKSVSIQKDYLKNYGINLLQYNEEIPEVASDFNHRSGQKLFNLLSYIKNYNKFDVINKSNKLIKKLHNSFLMYADINVFFPGRIKQIFKHCEIETRIDSQNPHCIIIDRPEVKAFINKYKDEWAGQSTLDGRMKLIIEFSENTLSAEYKDILLYIWKKLLLSGVYFLAGETIRPNTPFVGLFDTEFFEEDAIDSFYKSDFIEVEKKIIEYKDSFNIDKLIVAAFLAYKTNDELEAYTLLNKASSLAWQSGKHLKYYLCKYNIDKIKHHFYSSRIESKRDQYYKIYQELTKMDLGEIYYSLPIEDRQTVTFLKNFIDYDFEYLQSNITSRVSGENKYDFENYPSLSNKVSQVWNFINYNHLFGEHLEKYRLYYKRSFQELVAVQKKHTIVLRKSDLLIAMHNLTEQEFTEIMTYYNIQDVELEEVDIENIKLEFKNLIQNCSNFISHYDLESKEGYNLLLSKLLNNYLQIFAFIKMSEELVDEILVNIFGSLFTRTNFNDGMTFYGAFIHSTTIALQTFIINQHLFGRTFNISTLEKIFDYYIDVTGGEAEQMLILTANLIQDINPQYTIPNGHIEKRLIANFNNSERIETLIELQTLLKNDYKEEIEKTIKASLEKRLNFSSFKVALKYGIVEFSEYKLKFLKEIIDILTHEKKAFDTSHRETLFAEILIEQGIDIKSDEEIQKIIESSLILKFWLDIDNFNMLEFNSDWIKYYNQILYNNHAKSEKILKIKQEIRVQLTLKPSRKIAEIYFKYFDKYTFESLP